MVYLVLVTTTTPAGDSDGALVVLVSCADVLADVGAAAGVVTFGCSAAVDGCTVVYCVFVTTTTPEVLFAAGEARLVSEADAATEEGAVARIVVAGAPIGAAVELCWCFIFELVLGAVEELAETLLCPGM